MHTDTLASSKRTRVLYIVEAALEYLISILVAGSFLASLTRELGFSDSLTGILSSIISLGSLFQLLSLLIRRTRQKKLVTILSFINQLLFMFLYVVPITPFSSQAKTVIFVVLIVGAYLFYNIAHPKKISWLMSFVDDHHRGRFTANKEIVSLAVGIAFSIGMGSVIDCFSEMGNTRAAFIVSAAVIFVLMVSHSLTMIFSAETPPTTPTTKDFSSTLQELAKDKNLIKIAAVFILYHVCNSLSAPFFGTYLINELGLNLSFISTIAVFGSVSRILFSRFWGKYADQNSFAAAVEKCFMFLGLSHFLVAFAVPSNGSIIFILYYLFHGIAMGGINSALINLIFDYVPQERRADSLAITQAFAGLSGFLTTLTISPLVASIQNNGNQLFGISIYAQQFITLLSALTAVIAIIFIRKYFHTKAKIRKDD